MTQPSSALQRLENELAWKGELRVIHNRSILYALGAVIAASCVYKHPIFMAINLPIACIVLIVITILKNRSTKLLVAAQSPKNLVILSSAILICCILFTIPSLLQYYGMAVIFEPMFFCPILAILGLEAIHLGKIYKNT